MPKTPEFHSDHHIRNDANASNQKSAPMKCGRCDEKEAEPGTLYCFECKESFRGERGAAQDRVNPMPGVHAVGKFNKGESPKTFFNGVANVCGMCGSDEIEAGYGFAGGFGLGVYQCCMDCYAIMDFSEDSGE